MRQLRLTKKRVFVIFFLSIFPYAVTLCVLLFYNIKLKNVSHLLRIEKTDNKQLEIQLDSLRLLMVPLPKPDTNACSNENSLRKKKVDKLPLLSGANISPIDGNQPSNYFNNYAETLSRLPPVVHSILGVKEVILVVSPIVSDHYLIQSAFPIQEFRIEAVNDGQAALKFLEENKVRSVFIPLNVQIKTGGPVIKNGGMELSDLLYSKKLVGETIIYAAEKSNVPLLLKRKIQNKKSVIIPYSEICSFIQNKY